MVVGLGLSLRCLITWLVWLITPRARATLSLSDSLANFRSIHLVNLSARPNRRCWKSSSVALIIGSGMIPVWLSIEVRIESKPLDRSIASFSLVAKGSISGLATI